MTTSRKRADELYVADAVSVDDARVTCVVRTANRGCLPRTGQPVIPELGTFCQHSPFGSAAARKVERKLLLRAWHRLCRLHDTPCRMHVLPYGLAIESESALIGILHIVPSLCDVSITQESPEICVVRLVYRNDPFECSIRLLTSDGNVDDLQSMFRSWQRISVADGFTLSQPVASFPLLIIDNFMPVEDCRRVQQWCDEHVSVFKSSVSLSGAGGDKLLKKERTSSSFTVPQARELHGENPDIMAIVPFFHQLSQRVENFTGYEGGHLEAFQIVRYAKGEQYVSHVDFLVAGRPTDDVFLRNGGQRCITMLLYLNEPPADESDPASHGGSTLFPVLDVRVHPKAGRCVFWMNVAVIDAVKEELSNDKQQRHFQQAYESAGVAQPNVCLSSVQEEWRTWHSGCPIDSAAFVKYAVNIWIRERRIDLAAP